MFKINLIINSLSLLVVLWKIVPNQVNLPLPLIVVVIGVMFFTTTLLHGLYYLNKHPKGGRTISSRATGIYKYYLPNFTFTSLVYCSILLLFHIYSQNNKELVIALELTLIIWGIFSIVFRKLEIFAVIGNKTVICNYLNVKPVFKECKITKVSRFLFFYKKIIFEEDECIKSAIVLPPITRKMSFGKV